MKSNECSPHTFGHHEAHQRILLVKIFHTAHSKVCHSAPHTVAPHLFIIPIGKAACPDWTPLMSHFTAHTSVPTLHCPSHVILQADDEVADEVPQSYPELGVRCRMGPQDVGSGLGLSERVTNKQAKHRMRADECTPPAKPTPALALGMTTPSPSAQIHRHTLMSRMSINTHSLHRRNPCPKGGRRRTKHRGMRMASRHT